MNLRAGYFTSAPPFLAERSCQAYSVVMAHVNDAVGEGEFVAASGGLLIMQGVGAVAGPLIAGFAMSAFELGFAFTVIATQLLMATFGLYRLRCRAAPP